MKVAEIIVATSDSDFDLLFTGSAQTANFITAADKERYEEKADLFTERIRALTESVLGKEVADAETFVIDDVWPDRSRYVESGTKVFGTGLLQSLLGLLTNEYEEWRIQVVVYEDVKDGTTMVGSIVLWSDKLLVDLKLHDYMVSNGVLPEMEAIPLRHAEVDFDNPYEARYTLLDPDAS